VHARSSEFVAAHEQINVTCEAWRTRINFLFTMLNNPQQKLEIEFMMRNFFFDMDIWQSVFAPSELRRDNLRAGWLAKP
jgi:hypothetical protein